MDDAMVRARDKAPHDRLHLLPSGFCGCLCPGKCWRWLIPGRRGVCICLDCKCGGTPRWFLAGLQIGGSS